LNLRAYIVERRWVEDCLAQKNLIEELENYIPDAREVDLKNSVFKAMTRDKDLFQGVHFYLPEDGGWDTNKNEIVALIEGAGGKITKTVNEKSYFIINEKNK
jgi:hypothetical protein